MWELEELVKMAGKNGTRVRIVGSDTAKSESTEKWVPARPINYKYRSLIERCKEAFAVFSGKADCFKWPEGQ